MNVVNKPTAKFSIYLTKTFSNDQGKFLQMGSLTDAQAIRDTYRLDRKGQGYSITVFEGNKWIHTYTI